MACLRKVMLDNVCKNVIRSCICVVIVSSFLVRATEAKMGGGGLGGGKDKGGGMGAAALIAALMSGKDHHSFLPIPIPIPIGMGHHDGGHKPHFIPIPVQHHTNHVMGYHHMPHYHHIHHHGGHGGHGGHGHHW